MPPSRVLWQTPMLVCAVLLAVPPALQADTALISEIEAASENGQDDEVRRLVSQANSQSPDDAAVVFWTGRVAMMDDDFDLAMKLFDEAREREPSATGRRGRLGGGVSGA